MKIGIDIDNVISNFNDTLLTEYLLHDKELRNSGIINKNADYNIFKSLIILEKECLIGMRMKKSIFTKII